MHNKRLSQETVQWLFILISLLFIPHIQGLTIITDCVGLQAIKNNLTANYQLGSNIDCSATLAWNGGAGFEPLGNSTKQFMGIFDGQGFTITALTINRVLTDNVGMFGNIQAKAFITAVGLLSVSIVGKSNVGGFAGVSHGAITNAYAIGEISGNVNVGGLVGYTGAESKISDAYTFVTVSGSGSGTGGLVGSSYGTITNVYAMGTVSGFGSYTGGLIGIHSTGTVNNANATAQVFGNSDVGGLMGHNSFGTVSNVKATGQVFGSGFYIGGLMGTNNGFITNAYANGNVSGSGMYIGGFVGYNVGAISNVYTTSNVSGSGNIVGGLVGENRAPVINAYAIGKISGSNNIGGLIGTNSGIVSNSYWDMQRSGLNTSAGGDGALGRNVDQMHLRSTFQGWDFTCTWSIVEGINLPQLTFRACGNRTITVFNCSQLQDAVTRTDATISLGQDIDCAETKYWNDGSGFLPGTALAISGNFLGRGYRIFNLIINRPNTTGVGLFVVLGQLAQIDHIGLVNSFVSGNAYVGKLLSWNSGIVSNAFSTGNVSGYNYVGGLVAYNYIGAINNAYSTDNVLGYDNVGGLVGYNGGAINNVYATGNISGSGRYVGGLLGSNGGNVNNAYSTGNVSGYSYVGGLVGDGGSSNIKKSYWNNQTSGQATSAGGTGKTTAALYQQTTFVGWNFITIWWIDEGRDYPKLLSIRVVNPLSNQNTSIGQLFRLVVPANTIVDSYDPLITYTASLENGIPLPAWLTFTSLSRTFSGTPYSGAQGVYSIQVTGTNSQGDNVSDRFLLAVLNRNPIQNIPLQNQTLDVDEMLSYSFPPNTFSDPDLDLLSYQAKLQDGSALPSWLSFQSTTRTFSGIPRSGAQGATMIVVIANDGYGGSVTGFFRVTVTNQAPIVQTMLSTLTLINSQYFQWVVPANTFIDPDNDPLILAINVTGGDPLPNWLAFFTTTSTLTGTPNKRGNYSLQVTASDDFGGQVTTPLTLVVPNTAPVVATPFPNQDVPLNTPFMFQVPSNTFFDLDQDSLTYAAHLSDGNVLPTWLSLTPAGIFSGTVTIRESLTIQLAANDGYGGFSTLTFILRVANQNPVVSGSIVNQTVWIDQLFLFMISDNLFYDPDNDTLIYQARLNNGNALPIWLNFTAQTLTFSGIPHTGAQGMMIIAMIVDDGFGGEAQATFSIQIPNRPPIVMMPIPIQHFLVEQLFVWIVPSDTFNDPDQDPLRLTIPSLPAGLQFNVNNQTLSGQLASNQPPFTLQIIASDGFGGSIAEMFNVTINHAPQLNGFIPNQAATVGNPFLFTFTPSLFTDVDGDSLSYEAEQINGSPLPIWLTFDSGSRTFMGIPKAADQGFLFVELQALDPFGGRAYGTFGVAISDLSSNQPPVVAVAIPAQSGQTGIFFSFQFSEGTFVDPNSDLLTYNAYLEGGSALPRWLTFTEVSRLFQGTPNQPETLRLSITASDGRGGLALTTFILVIADSKNYPPYLLNPIQQQMADVGQLFKFIVPVDTFTDPNNDVLTLTVSQGGGPLPHWLKYDATSKTFSGKPSSSDTGIFSDKRYRIDVTASDGEGSAVASFEISVRGESTVEIVIKVFGILGSIGGFIFTIYRNRAWLWNHTAKRWYELPPQYAIIDQDYEWTATLPKVTQDTRIQKIIVYQEGQEVEGATGLPKWMIYNINTANKSKTHQINGKPLTDDVSELDVRVTGYDNRILASFLLAVVQSEKEGKAFVTRVTSSTTLDNCLEKCVWFLPCLKCLKVFGDSKRRDIEMPLIDQNENN